MNDKLSEIMVASLISIVEQLEQLNETMEGIKNGEIKVKVSGAIDTHQN